MTDFIAPETWKHYGLTKDQSTFILPGHTVSEPHLAIFDRKVPSVANGGSSVPTYRVRVIRGVSDSEGNPVQTRVTVDCTIRWPLQADVSAVKADMDALGEILTDPDFQDDAAAEQLLPTLVAEPT